MTDKFPRVSAARVTEMKRVASSDYSYHLTSAEFLDLLADRADMETALAEAQTKAKAYVDEHLGKLRDQAIIDQATIAELRADLKSRETTISDAKAEIERLDQTLTDTCAEAFNSQQERDERNKYYGRATYDAGAKLCAIITEARKEGFKVTLDIGEGLMEPTVMHVVVDDPEKQ